MKIKANKIGDLGKIGFVKVVLKENVPAFEYPENMETKEVNRIGKLEQEFHKNNYVVENDYDELYYYNDSWIFELKETTGRQYYSIVINKKTNEVQILATQEEGCGGIVNAGDIFKTLIAGGFID